ncbi:CPBP family intramembrane glutamic endopeptidase [Leifsonia sp. NPDC058248]|uniref:CPBP family intramembrane glutamic endopeptidase n=1 Tax=Leifsonia sp. NPDC058248 TaxID=3346402 RepID=UPI0036DCC526
MPDTATTKTGWAAFWDRGGWWKALLAAAVYLALYNGASLLIGLLFGSRLDAANLFATPQSVFFGLALPVIVGSIILLAFLVSVRWLKPLFSRQPIRGRGWMWIAPALAAAAILLRLFGTDYGAYSAGTIAVTFVAGIFIGFSEEVLTRGIAVTLLRKHGYSELAVMLLSSLIFALLHASNLLLGQPVLTVLLTMGFTFVFGVCMYLTLRVTGNLIYPIILHALTDPATFLATGGIDTGAGGPESPLLPLAGAAVWGYLILTVVALFLVRGRVGKAAALTQ